jgi:Na+/H+-dicarboxylate symporter
MCRTVLNVIGDLVAATTVSALTKDVFDEEPAEA